MKNEPKRRFRAPGWRAALAALAVMATTAGSTQAQDLDQLERQRLFSQVKPAVVMIYFELTADIQIPRDDGSILNLTQTSAGGGSGWIITPDGFIVTNGHVVELYHEENEDALRKQLLYAALQEAGVFSQIDPELGRAPTEAEAIQQTLEIFTRADITLKKDLVAILQNGEMLEASVREYSPPVVPVPGKVSIEGLQTLDNGRDVAILKVSGRDLPTMTLGNSDASAIGEEIFVAGYPGNARFGQISDASILEASFTRGQISSLKAAVGGEDLIQVDAATSKGSSGGPVFNREGEVIGILTMGASEVMGFAVTSNTVRDFFRASGAVPGESLFDRTWTRALDAYYGGDWDGAIAGFDEALRVMPDLPDAENLRRMAMTAKDEELDRPVPTPEPVNPNPNPNPDPGPTPGPAGPDGPDGIPTWILGLVGAGVLLLAAGMFMRREPAMAGASAGGGSRSAAAAPAATMAAAATRKAQLRVTGGPLQGNRFEIEADGLRIGRDPAACQIVLSEASVSREHAVIRQSGGAITIKNLSGTNPTYVNERAIQEATLSNGDKVKVGDSIFTVEA